MLPVEATTKTQLSMGREDDIANQGSFRKILRGTLHYLCYHFVLSRSSPLTVRASGFRLKVAPTVFPPHPFFSSNFFAGFIGRLDLKGKNVADVGTGSGILALAAARSGAASVVASDINPNAAYCAVKNAAALGFSGQIQAVCCDVMSALAPCPLFDVIFSSPPMHAGKARDLADAGWHAGANYSGIAPLFSQGKERLKPGGAMYVMLSSHGDLGLFGKLIEQAGLQAQIAAEHSIYFESYLLYKLTPVP